MSRRRSPADTTRRRSVPATRPRNLGVNALIARLPTSRPCICLDYDGTLVPIASKPELATFEESGRVLLRNLARHMPLAIVSGRARAALRSLVGVRGLVYVGNHGLEIAGPRIIHLARPPRNWRGDLERMTRAIEASAPPNVVVERKGLSVSIHYRLLDGATRRRWVRQTWTRLTAWSAAQHLHAVRGKAVFELRPFGGWNKGSAVRWLLSQPSWRGRTPIYLGDDMTDEDAFEAVRADGIGILVGPPRITAAKYRVSDWNAARELLGKWLFAMSRSV